MAFRREPLSLPILISVRLSRKSAGQVMAIPVVRFQLEQRFPKRPERRDSAAPYPRQQDGQHARRFCFRNSRDLIHHQATNSSQSVALARLSEEPKKRSIGWIGRERAHRNGIDHVETIVLEGHHRTRFSCVVLTARNGPNLAALHFPPQSVTASIESWSCLACGLLATARDCLRASATKEGERMSGTQIWMGRKPC